MDTVHNLLVKLKAAFNLLTSPGSDFSLYSLGAALVIGFIFLILRRRARRGRANLRVVARAVFSQRLLKCRSTRADAFYTLVNIFALGGLIGWGLLASDAVLDATRDGLDGVFGARPASTVDNWGLRAAVTLVGFLAYEFGYWLDHMLKHRIPALWELHKTHHTAEVLTPLTAFRVHPLDTLIFANIVAVTAGGAQGIVAFFAGAKATEFSVDGSNIVLVCFIFTIVHLQHSQFWIAFPGLWGRIFMSPAQHQIHHSVDPAHYNANYGSCLAIFDLAYGSLITASRENPHLRFGVVEDVDDPHGIQELLLDPVVGFVGGIAQVLRRPRRAAQPAE